MVFRWSGGALWGTAIGVRWSGRGWWTAAGLGRADGARVCRRPLATFPAVASRLRQNRAPAQA